jgi:selenide,water dikinase
LIACEAGRADALLRTIVDAGYPMARIVGRAGAGAPCVTVEA